MPAESFLYTSLALDSAGDPHVTYYSAAEADLVYAHWEEGAWQIETVASAGDVGKYTSLALDGKDRPHISFLNETADDLICAHFDGRWR